MKRTTLTALLGAAALAAPAAAHQAPSGWSYPAACCSNQDCREVSAPRQVGASWLFSTGHVVADKDVRPAPDGLWHLCLTTGDKIVLCAFGPKPGV